MDVFLLQIVHVPEMDWRKGGSDQRNYHRNSRLRDRCYEYDTQLFSNLLIADYRSCEHTDSHADEIPNEALYKTQCIGLSISFGIHGSLQHSQSHWHCEGRKTCS